jgi:hypothetical protein
MVMKIAQLRRSHNRRHELAQEVVEHLDQFETDLGRALASGSRLVGFLPGARAEATLSPVVGQQAIGHFVSSLGLISEAMEAVVAGHLSLGETGERFGSSNRLAGRANTARKLKSRIPASASGFRPKASSLRSSMSKASSNPMSVIHPDAASFAHVVSSLDGLGTGAFSACQIATSTSGET